MTRIVVALVAGIGGLLFATPAQAQEPSSPSTPVTGVPVATPAAGPVIYSGGYNTAPARRGLFGRLRNRNTYSGPGNYYTTPTGGMVTTPGTVMPMPGTGIPAPMPSSRPTTGPAALGNPQPLPSTGTSSSLSPGTITTRGSVIPASGTMIVNGQVVPASGTIMLSDGTIVPANYNNYGTSQPVRRGLFGRLRNR